MPRVTIEELLEAEKSLVEYSNVAKDGPLIRPLSTTEERRMIRDKRRYRKLFLNTVPEFALKGFAEVRKVKGKTEYLATERCLKVYALLMAFKEYCARRRQLSDLKFISDESFFGMVRGMYVEGERISEDVLRDPKFIRLYRKYLF
jgi:hypothetical protein